MNHTFTLLALMLSFFSGMNAHAQTGGFSPVRLTTNQFKAWEDHPSTHTHYDFCEFKSGLNEEGNAILLQIGIEGSNWDFFGWDMPIPLADFPLKAGYHRDYRVPGMSAMELNYDGVRMNFTFIKKGGLWNMISPFTLEIDPTLTQPKAFKGVIAGFDKDLFGNPVKHAIQECHF